MEGGSIKAKRAPKGPFQILAERVGFEPTVRYNRTPDFESGAFDHSATFPTSRMGLPRIHFTKLVVVWRSEDYRIVLATFQALFHKKLERPAAAQFDDASSSRSTPPRYGRSAAGTVTDPSAFWKFSSTATSVRPTASPEPFSVCSSSGLPCALR